MKEKKKSAGKDKKTILIASIIILISVIILVSLPQESDEKKVIEISKKVLDQYAPQYEYLADEENWLVSFNDTDGSGTITVWVPAKTPNDSGVSLRASIMYERLDDKITPYFIQIDNKTIYQIPRQGER